MTPAANKKWGADSLTFLSKGVIYEVYAPAKKLRELVFYYRRAVAYTVVYDTCNRPVYISHILPEFTKKSTACIMTTIYTNLNNMHKKTAFLLSALGALALLGAGCSKSNLGSSTSKEQILPSITTENQPLTENNQVVIKEASIGQDGWIAIHTKENGQIGEIIGYTSLLTGKDSKIKVTVDRNKVTPSLVAMLHYDRDPKGAFESPGADGPVILDQQVIMQEFTIINQGEITKKDKPTEPTTYTGARKEFIVTAKQWSFTPSSIKVKKGDTVVLKLKSTDITHGIIIPEFNINETMEPGVMKTIEFVADKSGSFSFSCSVPCGAGHKAMSGTLIVE